MMNKFLEMDQHLWLMKTLAECRNEAIPEVKNDSEIESMGPEEVFDIMHKLFFEIVKKLGDETPSFRHAMLEKLSFLGFLSVSSTLGKALQELRSGGIL